MNLNTRKWKAFVLQDILSIRNGKGITAEEIEENPGNFCAVQSGEENNGVLGKISLSYCKSKGYTLSEKPCLTVARTGSAGFVSFQAEGCVVGDSAKILLLDDEVASPEAYIFLQTILLANRFKYSYGRKVTEEKYMQEIVDLPIQWASENTLFIDKTYKFSSKGYVPDWKFMEQYVKRLHHKPLTTKNKSTKVPELNIDTWKEFKIGKIFQTNIAKSIDFGNTESGCNVYVGRTSNNNGVQGYVSDPTVENGNCIIIGMVGENWAFYQPAAFVASQNILVLRTPQLNCLNALFLCSILSKSVEIFRMNYALPLSKEKMNQRIIKLPIQRREDGSPVIDINYQYSDEGYVPDWQFMEDYIKSLPYGDRL